LKTEGFELIFASFAHSAVNKIKHRKACQERKVDRNDHFHSAWIADLYTPANVSSGDTMDLFWSGLARRASEHTWNERRSQFSKVHDSASRDVVMEKQKNCKIDVVT